MSKSEPIYRITIKPAPIEIDISARALAEAVQAHKDPTDVAGIAAVIDWAKSSLSDYSLDVMDFTYQVREVRTNRIVDAGDDKDFASNVHPN
jgi:hypothetical protein